MTRPKSTTVIFVRHGKTPTTGKVLPGRTAGLHLSEEGSVQAEIAAEIITESFDRKVAAVYSSPLERARETAKPISKAVKRKVQIDEDLNECDFGRWTGKSLDRLRRLDAWDMVQHSPSHFRFPGGESFLEMQTRINNAIVDLCAKHNGQTIVIVSHADVIKAALATALGMSLDSFQRITVSPASISVVSYAPAPHVLCINTTDLKEVTPS